MDLFSASCFVLKSVVMKRSIAASFALSMERGGAEAAPSAAGGGCGAGEWQCENEACVPRAALCDGVSDCGDYSDEWRCSEWPVLVEVHSTTSANACG